MEKVCGFVIYFLGGEEVVIHEVGHSFALFRRRGTVQSDVQLLSLVPEGFQISESPFQLRSGDGGLGKLLEIHKGIHSKALLDEEVTDLLGHDEAWNDEAVHFRERERARVELAPRNGYRTLRRNRARKGAAGSVLARRVRRESGRATSAKICSALAKLRSAHEFSLSSRFPSCTLKTAQRRLPSLRVRDAIARAAGAERANEDRLRTEGLPQSGDAEISRLLTSGADGEPLRRQEHSDETLKGDRENLARRTINVNAPSIIHVNTKLDI